MAKPQLENGYTKIANKIMDALAKIRIPGEARQVIDTVIRKTYGFNKTADDISLSQFCLATGLKKPTVCKALRKCILMNIITQKGNEKVTSYGFNKDFDTWKPLPKKVTVTQKGNLPLPKKPHTKDIFTKDIYIVSQIVSYLNSVLQTNYKPTSENTRRHINARLHDGFSFEDFKKVIDNKSAQWKDDPQMAKYLRPATLFGTKFESYLNEKIEIKRDWQYE